MMPSSMVPSAVDVRLPASRLSRGGVSRSELLPAYSNVLVESAGVQSASDDSFDIQRDGGIPAFQRHAPHDD